MFSTAINDYVKGFRRFEPYAFGIFLGADYNF